MAGLNYDSAETEKNQGFNDDENATSFWLAISYFTRATTFCR